jgi:sulfatase maturation enzyme AslB (radical SAM superfamily)
MANQWCAQCIKQEKQYGRSRRQAALKIQTNDQLIWPELKKSIRRYQQDMKGHIKDRCFEVQIKVYGNKCNLDCFMCHPFDSTKRIETMRHKALDGQTIFSPHVQKYARSGKTFDLDNDSLDKISEQIVDIAPYIYAMKLIGGEPLVMKPYYKLLEKLVEKAPDDCQKMLLKFQTNMQTMNMDKMKVTDFIPKFGLFEFTVSLDSVGMANNYIRRRSNWDEIVNNIKTVRKYPNVKININGAISFLSVLRFYQLPEWYDKNIDIFETKERGSMINWSNIRAPAKLAANVLPDKLKQELIPKYEKWPDIQQVLREDNNGLDYKETINYLLTIDKRYKGTKWEYNLFDVFPELKEYY